MQTHNDNKRIAKNTLLLYVRMFLSLLVSLYTSRVVLHTLGVDDFGIYGVVGGVVGMFSFLNTAMAGATSRFLTFEMGVGNAEKLKDTFSVSWTIHLAIALILFVFAETIGLWVVGTQLVLPEGRIFAAHIVYQCSILSMCATVIQVPFSAALISHERMDAYAFIELLHVFMKLLIVFVLMIGSIDKLILYAVLILFVSILVALIYVTFAVKHFQESHFRFLWRKDLIRPMLSFSGWNILSECGYSFRVYGSNIVLNTFFGTVVNAAGGIAATVQGTLLGFVANVVTAVRPQIIMSYSRGDYNRMNTLLTSSIRLNLFLSSLISIPLFVDTHYVLQLWLGDVPPYCVSFCKLLLFTIFITTVSQIVTIGIHASGRIKATCMIRSIIYILTPFVIYCFMKWSAFNPNRGYVIIVISQMVVCLTDIYILRRNLRYINGFSIFFDYCKSVIGFLLVVLFLKYLLLGIPYPFVLFVVRSVVEWLLVSIFFWLFVLKEKEKIIIVQSVRKFIYRFVR